MSDRSPDPQIEALRAELLERMEELGMTQADLARKADQPTSYIHKLLRQKGYTPSVPVLRWLASLMDCDLEIVLRPKISA